MAEEAHNCRRKLPQGTDDHRQAGVDAAAPVLGAGVPIVVVVELPVLTQYLQKLLDESAAHLALLLIARPTAVFVFQQELGDASHVGDKRIPAEIAHVPRLEPRYLEQPLQYLFDDRPERPAQNARVLAEEPEHSLEHVEPLVIAGAVGVLLDRERAPLEELAHVDAEREPHALGGEPVVHRAQAFQQVDGALHQQPVRRVALVLDHAVPLAVLRLQRVHAHVLQLADRAVLAASGTTGAPSGATAELCRTLDNRPSIVNHPFRSWIDAGRGVGMVVLAHRAPGSTGAE